MPSLFPGMDPWLEGPALFPDFHQTFLTYLGDALNAALPDPYVARGATRVWVEDDQRREPDVGVFDPLDRPAPDGGFDTASALAGAGLSAVASPPIPDPLSEQFLEIRSASVERLVTVIELLSPANKTPGGTNHGAYRQKQTELRLGNVSLVEIDLLRGGLHSTAVSLAALRQAGEYAYHICVSAAGTGGQVFIGRIRLEERLPAVPIPLDPGVAPVSVDLQPLLERCYDNRRYGRQVRYLSPPDPPLTPAQREWADGILRSRGIIPAANGGAA